MPERQPDAARLRDADSGDLNRFLRDTLESLTDNFVVVDADDRFVLFNAAAAQQWDLASEDIVGMRRIDLWRRICPTLKSFDGETISDADDMDAWAERIIRRLREPPHDPIPFQLRNGAWRLISRHSTAGGGQIVITANIDKMKAEEMALRRSEAHFRSIVEDHPLPVTITDLESGEILYASPAAVAMFGFPWPPDAPTYAEDYFTDPADWLRMIDELKRGGEGQGYEISGRRADGTTFWAHTNSRPMNLDGRQVVVSNFADVTEAKAREVELLTARRNLQDAIESLSEGFALFDPADMLVMCNSQYRDFHSVSADIIKPGMRWIDLMRADLAEGLFVEAVGREEEFLRERIEARRQFQRNMEYEQSDGRWVAGSNIRTREGGIVVTLRDVTRRRHREMEVRAAWEMLEDAIESLPEGFVIWGANDEFVMCNQRYREINKISESALKPGVTWKEWVRIGAEMGQYEEAIGRVDEWYAQRLASMSIDNVSEYQLADGRWVMASSHAIRQGGRVAMRRDITERKKMEEALRESEELVRRILEACPVPVAMFSTSAKLIYANPANVTLFGSQPAVDFENVAGRWTDVNERNDFLMRLYDDRQVSDFAAGFRRADGSTFPASISARMVDYKGEDVIVSTVFDMTERLAVEAELEQQREALYQSEKLNALGTLLAGVAHELNNPLSVVSGQALLLEETTADDKIRKRASMIGEAADRCARIVKSFLAMARKEPGELTDVDINEVVDMSLEMTGYGLRTADVHVNKRLSRNLPAVLGSGDQLNQVVTNLIVNAQQALQAGPAPRRVSVSTRHDRKRQEIAIRVTDNGPGIRRENRRRVFEPFFTTKSVGEGTGIGLAICHHIVEAHRGTIAIEEPRGGGASFVVRLPVPARRAAAARPGRKPTRSIRPCRVLVVDDEPDVAQSVADVLHTDGHSVVMAGTVADAMAELEGGDYDLIISDLRLPDSDGFGLFEPLRDRPDLLSRLAFVTGDTMNANARDFLAVAGRPYMEKPITPDDLRDLVIRTIDQVRADGSNGDHA